MKVRLLAIFILLLAMMGLNSCGKDNNKTTRVQTRTGYGYPYGTPNGGPYGDLYGGQCQPDNFAACDSPPNTWYDIPDCPWDYGLNPVSNCCCPFNPY